MTTPSVSGSLLAALRGRPSQGRCQPRARGRGGRNCARIQAQTQFRDALTFNATPAR